MRVTVLGQIAEPETAPHVQVSVWLCVDGTVACAVTIPAELLEVRAAIADAIRLSMDRMAEPAAEVVH